MLFLVEEDGFQTIFRFFLLFIPVATAIWMTLLMKKDQKEKTLKMLSNSLFLIPFSIGALAIGYLRFERVFQNELLGSALATLTLIFLNYLVFRGSNEQGSFFTFLSSQTKKSFFYLGNWVALVVIL